MKSVCCEDIRSEFPTELHTFICGRYVNAASTGQGPYRKKGCVFKAALEATQGQMDGFFSQLPYKCHIEELAPVGD